jgi:hypothetical protein
MAAQPQPADDDEVGEERQRVELTVKHHREPRHYDEKDEDDREDAGADEKGRIDERIAQLAADPRLVLHLGGGVSERFAEPARHFARLDDAVDVRRKARETAGEGERELLAAA